jgi:hypothetical protein
LSDATDGWLILTRNRRTDGAQMGLSRADMELTHTHLAGSSTIVTKDAFVKSLISAIDPGPAPRPAAGAAQAGGSAVEGHVPLAGEELEESSVLRPAK